MSKLLIAVVCSMTLFGCSTLNQTEVSMGIFHTTNSSNVVGHSPMGIIEVMQPISKDIKCGITHQSYVTEGKPFNNREESWYDAVGCKLRIK